jgi:hypothetical protein
VLQSGLAAAAIATVPRTGQASAQPRVPPPDASEDEAGARLLQRVGRSTRFLGLTPGLALGAWTILDVRAHAQAIALVVRAPEGDAYQVDVLAREPDRDGIAQSEQYSVFLVNEGDGATASHESHGRGALAIGHYLRWAEANLDETPPRLATLSERLRTAPDGEFKIA